MRAYLVETLGFACWPAGNHRWSGTLCRDIMGMLSGDNSTQGK